MNASELFGVPDIDAEEGRQVPHEVGGEGMMEKEGRIMRRVFKITKKMKAP